MAAALLTICAAAGAEVYKSTDGSGRVQYSDKPPPGAAAASGAAGAAASIKPTAHDLSGEWTVANIVMDGVLRRDDKLSSSTWTFRDGELAIRTTTGGVQSYSLRLTPGAQPSSFELTPVPPSKERGGSMIYQRDGDKMRVAFFDNLRDRPASFEPAPKKVVLTLVAARAAGANAGPGVANVKDACALLREAGVTELLGTERVEAKPGANPATACRIEGAMGFAVTLALTGAATRANLERERDRLAAERPAGQRGVVSDEPDLGPGAFSVARGNSTMLLALKGETLATFRFDFPAGNQQRIVGYARRVLARG